MKIVFYYIITSIFSLTGVMKIQAQVCTGSLGDPVASINFGAGTGIGSALPPSKTSYTFSAADCPVDGSYTIINATTNCYSSTWHSVPEDHTPNDVNGYMMLVNASLTPSDFYLDTITGLCANTTYEFSAWVVNVLKTTSCQPTPSRPKLVFTIETTTGAILGTYSTGDIAETGSPQWNQYGLFFTSPPSTTTVVIRIRNNAPGGCGNDLALDDISFRACGPNVATTVMNTSQTSVDLCVGSITTTVLSGAVSGGYTNPVLQWQVSINNGVTWTDIAGANGNMYTFTGVVIGVYKYRLTVVESGNIGNLNCRVASNITTITIHDLPLATAGSNSPVCEGRPVNLTATGGSTYTWAGPGGFTSGIQNPAFTANVAGAGNYIVTVKDAFGCVNAASTLVTTLSKPLLNVFPNPTSICIGDSVLLTAAGGISYLWSPAAGLSNPISASTYAKPALTTTYTVRATGANACTDSLTVEVAVFKKPVVSAGPDRVLLNGQSARINAVLDTVNVNYYWTPPDFLDNPLLVRPTTTPNRDIAYILHAVSGLGCGTATDTVLIKVYENLYIPNAFTPNGDGKNDRWEIRALASYPGAKLQVFNRYGELVFTPKAATDYWDGTINGKKAVAGSYVYLINLNNDMPLINGHVLIIR
jgi:gliding motility-associated-like protein